MIHRRRGEEGIGRERRVEMVSELRSRWTSGDEVTGAGPASSRRRIESERDETTATASDESGVGLGLGMGGGAGGSIYTTAATRGRRLRGLGRSPSRSPGHLFHQAMPVPCREPRWRPRHVLVLRARTARARWPSGRAKLPGHEPAGCMARYRSLHQDDCVSSPAPEVMSY